MNNQGQQCSARLRCKLLHFQLAKYNCWGRKTDETNWSYYGLVLDWYFDESVLAFDFLNIEDFFDCNGDFTYVDTDTLKDQYKNATPRKRLQVLENILNILKHTSVNKEQNTNMIQVVIQVLLRDSVKIINPETGYILLEANDIIDYGSYCNIVRVKEGLLKKVLKPEYFEDEQLRKRMKYEYENMSKLRACPYILNVYTFNVEDNSYLMEQGDKNLFKHLNDELELTFEDKLKIISDILSGMTFAHNHSIIHRDLHLGNILKIGSDFVICDFGLSKDLSIERSMKSSHTEKNNHLFVDPLAITDFKKLDLQSDIYSIGKIIDYIFTSNGAIDDHIFKTIVERSTSRNKSLRYDSVEQIINEIELVLKNQSQRDRKKSTITKILNEQYDTQVHEYIMDLVEIDRICKFIVTHQLSTFGKIIEQFESAYQIKITQSIAYGYSEATGYGGWGNYDIFASISYYLCKNSQDIKVIELAKNILEECADIRYFAKDLLEEISD
ncbi:protein kinase domain-containing protein [Jeotgalibaca caeni]|uniref:protein kinase domain-containing protein n=1 Tax=Jeotgalibaca caeni TaxID=3028623 RepID=UPI00237E78DB|nr:protein kinase [Jeotgalibaca caeni]MDE1549493.1 protein kinase [Jeotgalibaca caeni]